MLQKACGRNSWGKKERQAQREIINLDLSSWFWMTDLISGAGKNVSLVCVCMENMACVSKKDKQKGSELVSETISEYLGNNIECIHSNYITWTIALLLITTSFYPPEG